MAYQKKTDNPNMGRPKKEIDKEQFEEMCRIHCTKSEICGILRVSEKTLNEWCKRVYDVTFSLAYKNFSDEGKMSLRRSQWRMSEKNPTMAIWLGKQELGQKDQVEQKIEVDKKLDNLTAALKSAAEQKEEQEE